MSINTWHPTSVGARMRTAALALAIGACTAGSANAEEVTLTRSLRAVFRQAFGSTQHFAQSAFCRLDTRWENKCVLNVLRPRCLDTN
jgi:hypothetical protein